MSLPRLRKTFVHALAAAAVLGLASPAAATSADLRFPAFAQAVAEAALGHDEVAAFYRETGYQPIWTGQAPGERARLEALLKAILSAGDHGLPVSAYDTTELQAMMRAVSSPRDRGRVEVELTRLFLTYAHQLQSGIVTPSQIDPGMVRVPDRRDSTALLTGFIEAENPEAFMHTLVPTSDEYARLMHKKFELERLIAAGGWGPGVPGSALRPGDVGMPVVALRNRLVAMGYLDRSATITYDADIQRAVQRFQENAGLNADGVAGPSTIRALNVEPEERLKSIIVAMERERWLSIDRQKRYIWVNLTDFTARVVDGGEITFETRSVVGQNRGDTRTPEFSDEMDHMVVNPSWYVPRSISVNEYLPGMIASGGASAGHLQLIDGRGNVVPRSAVNWEEVNPRNFPFDLKQPPSRGNALGLVKFMFPNQYNIYLHDTPSKSLFNNEVRTYSHGCVRLADPFDFAYTLLAPQTADPEGYFHSVLDTGRETRVDLEPAVPVHIVYRTAYSDLRGHMSYRADVYGRDAKVWAALEAAGVRLPGYES
ncbi:murein L,D-transpeptidase [Maritimibacter sp. HL-12]|jgi:L,D-transpeptidase YcbB|uniref:L,D-transpeptidase family protein n=1 Tax=Maritimibacter sp. HL-12 TaxID=1162418 RepID=UPI000A0F302A|nr:L,D-transpeptidase family protein [Maritimibacter sp. HL-12]SMH56528.1 Murein L,D-transpeptidase YcbB/YkuD [Maritimibacter sp. HL-12]